MGSRLENNSNAVRKRIEKHIFDNEEGEEYEGSKFGGFPEYFRRKKIKLQNLDAQLRSESAGKPNIFRGIVAHVNGYTQPSLNDIHKLVVEHGGGFCQYLDGKTTVTHIIASNLTPKKAVEFRKYRIVKPAWVVDSVQAGRLLPWNAYRVIDEGGGQKVLKLGDGNITSQVNDSTRRSYRDQTDRSWYTSQLVNSGQNVADQPLHQQPTPPTSSELVHEDIQAPTVTSPDGVICVIPTKACGCELAAQLSSETTEAPPQTVLPDGTHQNISAVPEDETGEDGMSHPAHALSAPASCVQPPCGIERVGVSAEECAIVPANHFDTAENQKRKSISPPASPQSKKAKRTAEEHNTLLLSDPYLRKTSTLNPAFLEQYYRESRLHHLSAWKADLKSQLQALAAESSPSQKVRQKRRPGTRQYILHVDFDSFFVAVSLKKHPEFVDKPAVVAHGNGSGSEIASCNYPARSYGIKNGMWMKRAHELCSDIKVLPYDFPAYEEASKSFYDAILATGGIVQSVSIDEALVDITALCLLAGGTDGLAVREGSTWREQAKADAIAQNVRNEVMQKTGCAVSVGIGGNILLAKLALRKAKPAGQYHVKPEEVLDFLADVEVHNLPGVAYSIGGKLEEIGIKFVKDIRECSKERLISVLGPKTGDKLWNYARGIDRTEVGDQVVRKSVSAEVNWGVRFETNEQAEEFVESLCGELNRRLLKEGVKGKQLTMKIMRRSSDAPLDPPKNLGHGKCDTFNKSVVLGVATNAKDVLAKESLSILRNYGFSPGDLRGLGVQMQKLEPSKSHVSGIDQGSQKRLQFNTHFEAGTADIHVSARDKTSGIHTGDNELQKERVKDAEFEDHKPIESDQNISETAKITEPSLGRPESMPTTVFKPETPPRRLFSTVGTQFVLPTQVDPRVLAELPPDIISRLAKHSSTRSTLQQEGKAANHETQLALPTQVDPRILAELPADIRARLGKHMSHASEGNADQSKDDSTSPVVLPVAGLPNHSQLDPGILEALPEDVRAEVLAQYERSPSKQRGQSILPQSPRKNRTVPPPRRGYSGRGRPRGSSLLSRLRGSFRSNTPTLTQSNFVAATRAGTHEPSGADSDVGENAAELDAAFLAALPDDIRQELLDQRRRDQLKRNAGIEVAQRRRHKKPQPQEYEGENEQGERVIKLPPRPPPPTFTTRKLSTLADLRDAMSLWYEEFQDEGPYHEDVEALGRYLTSVVTEEGNMGKAVSVVKWLAWIIDKGSTKNTTFDVGFERISEGWNRPLEEVKDFVRNAVRERGLGDVDL